MLHAQRLAVGLERHQHVVQRLLHRDRAAIGGGVGALDEHPAGREVRARLDQQGFQRHADILHVVDHAVGELRAVELGARPLHAGVGGAFAEVHPALAREPLKLGVAEHQRPGDHAVDHQAVVVLRQLDGAGVVALEGAALRRDRAVEGVDRREVDRADRVGGQPGHVAAHHLALEMDRHPVGRGVHAVAKTLRPGLDLGDQRIGRRRPRADRACGQRAPCCDARAQKAAPCLAFLRSVTHGDAPSFSCVRHQAPATTTESFGASVTTPILRIWLSSTSQICGPSVPSLTEAQPPTV